MAEKALQEVCARAGADAAFRDLCLRSPAEAVKEATGRELPAGYRVRFVDNQRADLTVVLPDMAAAAELSDRDLEDVSGGIKCAIGSCGGSDVCGITDPCAFTKGSEGDASSSKKKGRV